MEAIFLYFGKMILTSGVLFLYYRLFLKDRTFHHYNRFYLLVLMLVSVLLPLIKIDYFTLEVRSDIYLLLNKLQKFNSTNTLSNDNLYFTIAFVAFGLVSFTLLAKLIYGILKIQKFKKIYPKENFEGLNFYQTNLNTAPFSYFKNLFWKDTILINSDLGRQILKHEMVHMEQKHSVDKLLVEVATSLFWFNPIFHIIKKDISLIHEYLADKKAIKNSDTKAFAQMLLASHFSGNILPGTSPFLSSNLKKRLKMLQKPKTKFGYAQRIFALPLLFVIVFAYLVNAKNREIENTNKSIATAISKLKNDTIKPNSIEEIHKEIDKNQKALEPVAENVRIQNEKIAELNKKISDKNKKISKLIKNKKTDSPEFEKLQNEVDEMYANVDKLYNNDVWKKIDEHYAKMDQLYAKLDSYYNSEAFRNQIDIAEKSAKEAEARVNSLEFKNQIKAAEKQAKEAQALVNSRKFKKQIKDAEKQVQAATDLVNSKQFKEDIQRAKEAAEKAALAAIDAETIAKKAETQAKVTVANITFIESNSTKEVPKVYYNYATKSGVVKAKDAKIFLNGKLISEDEMKKIPSEKIESVNVITTNNDGSKEAQILIKTK